MTSSNSADDKALRSFADYYGFVYRRLSGHDPYCIEGAGDDFEGRVEAIRITQNGRFGNIFLQLIHAIALARALGCRTIQAFAFEAGPQEERVDIDGLRLLFPRGAASSAAAVPTLRGHFFNSYPFDSALRALPPAAAWEILQTVMRPLFRRIWQAAPVSGAHTAVVHFRAGDVFGNPRVSPWHTQPPASYYQAAIAHLRAHAGVEDVRLVFEDEGNPAIAPTKAWLRAQAIPFVDQSSDLTNDAACLATATHIVASVSTLTEVAAMLSQTLRSYTFFRQAESHFYIHQRADPLVAGVLALKGVELVCVEDRDGGYVQAGVWRGDAEQTRTLIEYPLSALAVRAPAKDADRFIDSEGLRVRLREAESEALRLRKRLVVMRDEEIHLRNSLVETRERLERSKARRLSGRLKSLRKSLSRLLGAPQGT